MAFDSVTRALRRTLLRLQPGVVTDGMLLERFVAQRDQAAFEELTRRHGPMVFRLCRRVLHHTQDAEDAFQATFVVLARKASSISKQESVGSWLYGVAYRAALQLRERTGRRRTHEQAVGAVEAADASGTDDAERSDLGPALDAELSRLPEKYRLPVVLCYLEGKTTEAAAELLGCGQSALKMRLLRARDLLQQRLTRRGVALSAATVASLLGQQAATAGMSERLVLATARGAAAFTEGATAAPGISAQAAAVAQEVLPTLPARKVRWAVALVLLLAGLGVVVALSGSRQPAVGVVEQRVQLPRGNAPFGGAGFSASNRFLALGDRAGGVRLYDVQWGTETLRLRRLPLTVDGPRSSLAFAQAGDDLALGTPDGTVDVWDTATGRKRATLRAAHDGAVAEIAFSPDGRRLAAIVVNGGITTWNLDTQLTLARMDEPDYSRGSNLTLTAQGDVLAIHPKLFRVRCWDAVTGQERKLEFPPLPRVETGRKPATRGSTVAIASTGSMIVACDDGSIHLWERPGKRLRHVCTLDPDAVNGVTFIAAPRADSFACWFRDEKRVRVWDVATGQELVNLHRPFEGGITCVAYSPDSQKFLWSGLATESRGSELVDVTAQIIDLQERRKASHSPGK